MPLATYKGLGALSARVEQVSLATTRVTLTQDQQGALLILDGSTGSTVEIALPAPAAGMIYNLFFSTGSVSVVTKILSTGVYDILVGGTTAKGVANATTVERGQGISLVAINEFRWIADRFGGTTLALATATS